MLMIPLGFASLVRRTVAALMVPLAVGAAVPVAAQDASAGGSIEAYRNSVAAKFQAIQASLPELHEVQEEDRTREIKGWLVDGDLSKAVITDRESGITREIYYDGEAPIFVLERRLGAPGAGDEFRYYLQADTLVALIPPGGVLERAGGNFAGVLSSIQIDAATARRALEPTWVSEVIDRMGGWLGFVVTTMISGLIVASFGYLSWKYLGALRRASQALKLAATRLANRANDPAKLFPHGPERLKDLWENFLDQREGTTVPHKGRDISTVDPADVFHDDAIFDAYNRNLAGTLAGFFTGLGIFGTFLGLVIGLWRVDTSPGGMLGSVDSLLGGMSTAFVTSLFGIFFSLLWLLSDRLLLHSAQRAATNFFLKVRQKYPVESADRLLHHLLSVEQEENSAIQDSKVILEEQKGILQTLSVDLAVAFEDAMSESMERVLAPKLAEMTQAMESLSVQMGDRQVSALDKMVETFQERLSEQLHGHLEGLASGLARASEWQEKVQGELSSLTGRLSEAADRQADLVEATNSAAAGFAGSIQALTEANAEARASLESFREASTAIAGAANAVGEQADALEARIELLGREQVVFQQANEALRVRLAEHIDALDARHERLGELWSRLGGELDETGKRLQQGTTEFSTLTTQKLKEIFSRFDSEMATVVEHLSGTLVEIREATEDLPRTLAGLRETFSNHSDGIGSATDRLEEVSNRLGELEAIARSLSRLGPLSSSIDEAAVQFEGASDSFSALLVSLQSQHSPGDGTSAEPGHRPPTVSAEADGAEA